MMAGLVAVALAAHRPSSEPEPEPGGAVIGHCAVCRVPFPCEVARVALDAVREAAAAPRPRLRLVKATEAA